MAAPLFVVYPSVIGQQLAGTERAARETAPPGTRLDDPAGHAEAARPVGVPGRFLLPFSLPFSGPSSGAGAPSHLEFAVYPAAGR